MPAQIQQGDSSPIRALGWLVAHKPFSPASSSDVLAPRLAGSPTMLRRAPSSCPCRRAAWTRASARRRFLVSQKSGGQHLSSKKSSLRLEGPCKCVLQQQMMPAKRPDGWGTCNQQPAPGRRSTGCIVRHQLAICREPLRLELLHEPLQVCRMSASPQCIRIQAPLTSSGCPKAGLQRRELSLHACSVPGTWPLLLTTRSLKLARLWGCPHEL